MSKYTHLDFQSHEGTSGTGRLRSDETANASFNPTRVRLERTRHDRPRGADDSLSIPRGYVWNKDATPRFDAHVGLSIPRGYVWNTQSVKPINSAPNAFNPTRVRLERHEIPIEIITLSSFQSHEGTSGTDVTVPSIKSIAYFQSHEGTSGTRGEAAAYLQYHDFQSHEGTSGTDTVADYTILEFVLSIPRGYVWNPENLCAKSSTVCFQSHEGTSGTPCRPRRS